VNTSKHTPGKFTAYAPGEATDSSPYWEIEDEFGHTATVFGEGPEAEANARLMAASPELIEALEAAVACLEAHRPQGKIEEIFARLDEHENAVMKPARAAIAKARGVA
jgi:hypothetical protein